LYKAVGTPILAKRKATLSVPQVVKNIYNKGSQLFQITSFKLDSVNAKYPFA